MLLNICEFRKSSAGKAVFFLRAQIKSQLRLHRKTVRHFERKERFGKDLVLRHGVHSFTVLFINNAKHNYTGQSNKINENGRKNVHRPKQNIT
jgi:hypothetical protein